MKPVRGFTLMELLIALAVFGLLVVLAYQSLNLLMMDDRLMRVRQADWQQLQRAVLFLGRDVRQAVPRGQNDGSGQPAPKLHVPSGALVEFTCGGNPDPGGAQQMRSSLQRVRYVVADGVLERWSWNLVDHLETGRDSAVVLPLLAHLKPDAVALRFMDGQHNWSDQVSGGDLPLALEITLKDPRWGEIKRIFPLYP